MKACLTFSNPYFNSTLRYMQDYGKELKSFKRNGQFGSAITKVLCIIDRSPGNFVNASIKESDLELDTRFLYFIRQQDAFRQQWRWIWITCCFGIAGDSYWSAFSKERIRSLGKTVSLRCVSHVCRGYWRYIIIISRIASLPDPGYERCILCFPLQYLTK